MTAGVAEGCWQIRKFGIGAGNTVLFPTTGGGDRHVVGWGCVKNCCKKADLQKDITATDMLHRVVTIYALTSQSETERYFMLTWDIAKR